jgi:hypothetical protein
MGWWAVAALAAPAVAGIVYALARRRRRLYRRLRVTFVLERDGDASDSPGRRLYGPESDEQAPPGI